ncbi:MAG TPA: hypothetical protein PK788_09165, partial [Gemmatimonadaceae bacterium]|nr:hypothetical protein [Gemmatimonadaceae bacterium]
MHRERRAGIARRRTSRIGRREGYGQLRGIVAEDPVAQDVARGPTAFAEYVGNRAATLEPPAERGIQRRETRAPRHREREADQCGRSAAVSGGQRRRQRGETFGHAGHVGCALQRRQSPKRFAVAALGIPPQHHALHHRGRHGAPAKEQRQQVIAIGAAVHHRRRAQEQQMPTARQCGERAVALAASRAKVVGLVDDDQRCAGRRPTVAQRLVACDAQRDLRACRRALPLLAHGGRHQHEHVAIARRHGQREHGLAAAHGIGHQRAAVCLQRSLDRIHALALRLAERERPHAGSRARPERRFGNLRTDGIERRQSWCHDSSGATTGCSRPYASSTHSVNVQTSGTMPSAASR